ncbi:MAG: bifunctional precorrin-2 dehydrogenase/sirohydrochlorin ferrochelatase [Planctomycetota bacterium]|nr:MAG: bifunctional precorrin-2 dehydrogenase/sirohydrochlorin ferrochelatase [Planctomycetota bacterium]
MMKELLPAMSTESSDTQRFLPIALNIYGADCLVVGGGKIGTRKAVTLARAGAKVTVVSPSVTGELAGEVEAGRIRWMKEIFREEYLKDFFLVVAATDDGQLNESICRTAGGRGALVCDASSAEHSQIIFGALLEHGQTTIAVFTGGRDPALSRTTRDRIARLLADENSQGIEP